MKKGRHIFFAAAAALALTVTACGSAGMDNGAEEKQEASYKKITAEEAKERMDSGDDIVVVDVRTEEEYEQGHIPGAVLIPNETIGEEKPGQLSDLDQEILVYCRSGNRSAQAAEKLAEAGFTNVYDFGGINDWPYETEKGQTGSASDGKETASGADAAVSAANGFFGAFETLTLEGEKVDQDIFTQAAVNMVNVWGTFCGPCIREMPDLAQLGKDYADRDFQIIGIAGDVQAVKDETAMKIIKDSGVEYTNLIVSPELYEGLYQIQAFPTTIFLDREGNQIGEPYVGARNLEQWKEIVEEVLTGAGI